jgi:hypothetical protein
MAANNRTAMHIQCSKRQMVRVEPLGVRGSGAVVCSHDEEPHDEVLHSEFKCPFKLRLGDTSGDVIAGLDWFHDVVVVLPETPSSYGGLVVRDSSPHPVRVYFPHVRLGVNIEVLWENFSSPNQNPRYADSRGICSSPDPYRVCIVAAALLSFG